MQNQKDSLSQKTKNSLFYGALFVGVFSIIAVIAIYTKGQNEAQLAQTKKAEHRLSEYARLDEDLYPNTSESNVSTEQAEKVEKEPSGDTMKFGAVDLEEDGMAQGHNKDLAVAESKGDSTKEKAGQTEIKQENVPVVADPGALDFNAESTMKWPVNGNVILPFSMETTVHYKTLDQYRCNPGVLIEAGQGNTVKSVYLGKVTKVTSDNTYGNMVTVYLGNDYSVVYGQLDTIYVKEGDFVKEGASIGTIGKPTDSFAEEGSHLFFQMLEGKEPIDPGLFIEE